MSDLGQDRESLKVKILECEYSIEQSKLAKKGIELDRARIMLKLASYEKSLIDIDRQIMLYMKNIEDLKTALQKIKE